MSVKDRWKHRRYMSWLTLVSALGFPAVLVVSQSDQIAGVAAPFYTFCGAVIASYIGWATVDDKNFKDNQHDTMQDNYNADQG